MAPASPAMLQPKVPQAHSAQVQEPVLVAVQVLNGTLLPIMLIFILRLINEERLMGSLKNSRLYNILGWGTFALITIAVVIMLGSQVLSAIGVIPR